MKHVIAVLMIATLSGCASTPLPVQDKPKPATDPFPFGDVSTFDNVNALFKGYHLSYSEEAVKKRTNAQTASETSFYSSVVGVLGGIAGSVPTAAAGGGMAAGAGLYQDRYRLQVQATNYETAADAMWCMYKASMDMSDVGLAALTLDDKPAARAARDIALDGLLLVRGKLYRLQSTFELGKPDPNKLKDAIQAPKQKVAEDQSKLTMLGAEQIRAKEAAKANLDEYKKKIDECTARITG